MASTQVERVHVDRRRELESFQTILSGEGQAHILLLKADKGMGKSSLLIEFASKCGAAPKAHVDLKPTYVTPEWLLDNLATQLGRHRFPSYERRSTEYVQQQAISIQDNRLEGGSSVNVAGPSREIVEQRRQILTNDFLNDLADSNPGRAVHVVMFDTYEEAGPAVQTWLTSHFITRARGYRWLVLVVAGREVPLLQNDWETWLLSHDMEALDGDSIREYVTKKGARFDESQLELLCSIGGNPLLIETVVAGWMRTQERTR